MKRTLCILMTLLLVISIIVIPVAASAVAADSVYLNGNIYTVDEGFTLAEAFAIKGGRFIYVGSSAGVKSYIGPSTAVFDLQGKTVIPGLMDSHIHFIGRLGERTEPRDPVAYWLPIDELQAVIANAIATGVGVRPGPDGWISTSGYNDAIWNPPVAHKDLLDVVSPDNPVFIRRYCGHAGFANSKAMEIAGIDKDGIKTPDPVAGTIVRDEHGNPTGVFISAAASLVSQHIPAWPSYTEEQLEYYLELGSKAALAGGLTVVHDASGSSMAVVNRTKKLYEEGRIKIRINDMLSRVTALSMGAPQVLYDNRLFYNSVKHFADGSLGGRGAAMIEDYSDMPGQTSALRPLAADEALFSAQVAELLALGFQSRTHAIGDLGNRATLNAYENAMNMTGIYAPDARLAIEHSQILHTDDLPRFGQLGIVASMQGVHATEDMLFAEDRIGPDRILRAYAWRSLIDDGVVIAGGSDYSVSPYNPFYGLHASVTRQDRNNQPVGGWNPQQCMTREEALRSYTNGGAYAMFAEDILGSIETGKLGDFVVIDRDYMTCPAEDIWKIQVLMTVVGGEVEYTTFTLADIDVKPSSINLRSRGVVSATVFSSEVFDAESVDPSTVVLAGASPVRWQFKDMNADGQLDLFMQFRTQDLTLTSASFWATINGNMLDDEPFQSTQMIKIVP